MAEVVDFVQCPIKNCEIDICECIDIQYVVDDAVVESVIDFKLTNNDKSICKACKKRIDPSL